MDDLVTLKSGLRALVAESTAGVGRIVEARPTIAGATDLPGDKYLVRFMQAGEGSSAIYPAEVLARDAAAAWPKGTRMRANHDGFCDQGGDIERLMAKTISDPWVEGDEGFVEILVDPRWADLVKQYQESIGLSITGYATIVEGSEWKRDEDGDPYEDEDGNRVPTKPTIERFLSMEEAPYNSIDFVEAPGANGRILQAIESAAKDVVERTIPGAIDFREHAAFFEGTVGAKQTPEASPPRANQEGSNMDPEETKRIAREAAQEGARLAIEALAPAPTEPAEVQFEDVAEAAYTAGLSEGSRRAVYAAVKGGVAVEAAIDGQKAIESEVEARVEARIAAEASHSHGVVFGGDLGAIETVSEAVVPATFDDEAILAAAKGR